MSSLFRFSVALLALSLAPPAFAQAVEDAAPAPEKAEKTASSPVSEASEPGASGKSGDFLSARFAGVEGDRQSAIGYLKESLAADPGNERLKGQLMLLTMDNGDMESAIAMAKELRRFPGHEPIVDLLILVDEARSGHYGAAREALSTPLEKSKGAVWMPLIGAWLDLAQGRLKKPLQPAQVLPEGEKAPPFLSYHLALINDAAGFMDMADKQYSLALMSLERAPFRAVEAAADFLRRQGQDARLAQLKKDYLAAHPEMSALVDSDDVSQMAMLMVQDGKSNPSPRRLVDNAADGIAEVFFTMGSVLYAVDSAQDTQYYLRMALHLRPEFPLAQLLLGNALENSERFAEAAAQYGAIRPESPLYRRALMRKAYVIERQGKTVEALAMLDARIAESPGDYEAYVVKGDLLRTRSRCAEAVEAYSQALEKIGSPQAGNWGIYFSRGACLEHMDQWEKAEADLRRALELSPEQPEVLNYLGYGLLLQGDRLQEGRQLIEQAYTLQPAAPHIIDSMGWAMYLTGDTEAAVGFLEQAIEAMPSDVTVNDHLGDAYWQAGRKTEARFQWQRALSFAPDEQEEASIRKKLRDGVAPLQVTRDKGVSQDNKNEKNTVSAAEPATPVVQ